MEKARPITLISCIALGLCLLGGLRLYADTISNVTVTISVLQCSDGIDNDSDALIDYPLDPGCSSSIDNDETDIVTYQCSDSIDNDGDGRVDYPNDLGCDSSTDDSEAGEITTTTGTGAGTTGGGIPGTVILEPTNTQVVFQGSAPVGSTVNVVANGLPVASSQTQSTGRFGVTVNELSPNSYIFLLYAKDGLGHMTVPVSYAIKVSKGSVTQLSGIVLEFDSTKKITNEGCPNLGDLNGDCRVDLVDFSIASFWWGRRVEGDFAEIEKNQLNSDGTIDLEDFSILAYHWTG